MRRETARLRQITPQYQLGRGNTTTLQGASKLQDRMGMAHSRQQCSNTCTKSDLDGLKYFLWVDHYPGRHGVCEVLELLNHIFQKKL